jgi:hypothetical protein
LLQGDPTIAVTASNAGWSDPLTCGDATLRVFFPPEKKTAYVSIQAVINAVKRATKSVVFCLFDPTDHDLLDAFFGVANAQKMMFGLINQVPEEEPKPSRTGRVDSVKVEIYDRSAHGKQLELAGHEAFRRGNTPQGFSW